MKIIDLHPEELIDRATRGVITPDERHHLDEHLAHCVACRMELMLRDDFAAEASADSLRVLVSNALVAAAEPVASPRLQPGRSRARRLSWTFLVAATLLMVTGLAAAQLESVARVMSRVVSQVQEAFGKPPPLEPARRAHRARPRVEAPPAPAPASEPPVAAEAAPVPAAEASPAVVPPTVPAAAVTPRQRTIGRDAAPRAVQSPPRAARLPSSTVAPAESAVAASEPASPAAPEPTRAEPPAAVSVLDSPAQTFERANGLRRHGAASEAITLYRELSARFPGSAEARLAPALIGRLELDRGEGEAALRDFELYLASGDVALREEVLAGRALALGRLERHAPECAAFATLLRAYPRTSYGALAKSRCGSSE